MCRQSAVSSAIRWYTRALRLRLFGDDLIGKAGTLTGEAHAELLAALTEQGFVPTESEAAHNRGKR